jgi:DNA-binding response OmpR family regulator
MSKVLIVDKSIDRKKRIAALKQRGFSVFPALQLSEARSRCKPGTYDLIIVNGQDETEPAASFCDELTARTPAQAVLLALANGSNVVNRDYVAPDEPEALAERAAGVLGRQNEGAESSQGHGESDQARASA